MLIALLTQRVRLGAGSRVLDVAAGTGKLSRQFIGTGAAVVAAEPSASMRHECRLASPGVSVIGGAAEALPLADHSFDLVTVAQAFHWFEPKRALHELARVMRPGGTVALVWNQRATSAAWAGALDAVVRRTGAGPPPIATMPQRFEGDPHFGPFARWLEPFTVAMTSAAVEDMVASRSYVRVLAPAARAAVLAEVREAIAPFGSDLVMPYTTSAYCAEVVAGPCPCAEEDSWSG